jgi:hypothetical protein
MPENSIPNYVGPSPAATGSAGTATAYNTSAANTGITVSESTIGSSSAMAIMDPFAVVNFIIKY